MFIGSLIGPHYFQTILFDLFLHLTGRIKSQLVTLLIACSIFDAQSQDSFDMANEESTISYDQIPVLITVDGYQSFYVDAVYASSDLLFVDISALFHALGIPCIPAMDGSIKGTLDQGKPFEIHFVSNQILVGNNSTIEKNGLVLENGILYLESSLFEELFGISLSFNYRTLSVRLKSTFELPAIKKQRLDKIRGNLAKIINEEVADSVIKRNYHLFKLGTLDWQVSSFQTFNGHNENRLGLGIGTEILHGETNVSILYDDRKKFDKRQLYYLWRWVNNENRFIKQAQIGRIYDRTISFINAPIIGVSIRNSPTTIRKASGYYTLNEITEPDWTVELYINNILIDYTKADASGHFFFKVPLVYGYNTLKLKYYGPMGEERTIERSMNVPYTIMPLNKLEYGLSAGFLQDSLNSRYTKGEFNYGLLKKLSFGGGMEYVSSTRKNPLVPYITTTYQPISKIVLSGEFAFKVRTRALLDFYFWKDALLEIDYAKYQDGQQVTRFNALEERKVKLAIPFKHNRIIGFTRFDFTQFVYKSFRFNQGNISISVFYKQLNFNSATQLNWITNRESYVITSNSVNFKPGRGISIRPSFQYNLSYGKFVSYKIVFEKSIPKVYFTIGYERNQLFRDNFFTINLRFNLSFARTNFSVSHNRGKVYMSESAYGSLSMDQANGYIHASGNSAVGKGGITIYPFLDLNGNNTFDQNEPMVKVSSVKVQGGKAIFNEKDSIIRIPNLTAYSNCILEFEDQDLENISWRFKEKKYMVCIDPNQFKRIDIAIIPVGELTGRVYLESEYVKRGVGRILVNIYNSHTKELVAKTLSEPDGYFDYLGLTPGYYEACIDTSQLYNLGYFSDPGSEHFSVRNTRNGDIISGMDFTLKERNISQQLKTDTVQTIYAFSDTSLHQNYKIISDTTQFQASQYYNKVTVIDSNSSLSTDPENENLIIWGTICTQQGYYCVQCGAFRQKAVATTFANYLNKDFRGTVGIILQNGLYKVRVGCMSDKVNADNLRQILTESIRINDLFVVLRK